MVVIRLMRTGKIHDPHYRIVVQEKRSKLNGKAIDIIGHYHPAQKDKLLVINKEKANEWLKKGAQTSDTVTNLFVKEGIFDKSMKLSNFYTPKAKEEVVEETPAAEVAATEEVPAEENIVATEEGSSEEAVAEEAETAPDAIESTEEA